MTCDNADLGTFGGSVEYGGVLARNGRYQLHAQSGTVRVIPEGSTGFEPKPARSPARCGRKFRCSYRAPQGRGPQNRWGTFGDGSAYIKAWTFMGT
jgi:hypothetical protein